MELESLLQTYFQYNTLYSTVTFTVPSPVDKSWFLFQVFGEAEYLKYQRALDELADV